MKAGGAPPAPDDAAREGSGSALPGFTGSAVAVPDTASFGCCGVRIDGHTADSAAAALLSRGGGGRSVHLCNAYTLSLAARDDAYRDRLNRADLNLADGMPLVWLGRRAGLAGMTRRVYGPDLMLATVDRGRSAGLRHYLYGGTEDVLDRLEAALQARYPGAALVGRQAPPFRALTAAEQQAAAERIAAAAPDVVWVGIGTPRQDDFADAMRDLVPATFVAVGAAFDFISGTKRQAPAWLQDHGLEWLYRLVREPRRLWRRYLVGNTVFLAGVVLRRGHPVGRRGDGP